MRPLTIISGASRGIGRAIAYDLEKNTDHNIIHLSSSVVDFEYYNDVFCTITKILEANEAEEINLILCAAQLGSPYHVDTDEIDRLFRINFLGNLAVINSVRNYTDISIDKLRIVWFAGGGAAFPFPEYFAYSITKVAVVRAVENLAAILKNDFDNVSIIALAPGAIDTDMLKEQEKWGIKPRTKTDISEPVRFVREFITDKMPSENLNGRFLHVRDIIPGTELDKDLFTLRRIDE